MPCLPTPFLEITSSLTLTIDLCRQTVNRATMMCCRCSGLRKADVDDPWDSCQPA